MLKFVSKNALLLSIAAIGCVAVIAGVNQLTAARIAEQAQAQKLKVLSEVLPAGHQDDALLANCLEVSALDAFGVAPTKLYRTSVNAQPVYISETVAPDGYSGNINLLAAISADGTVLGVRTIAQRNAGSWR